MKNKNFESRVPRREFLVTAGIAATTMGAMTSSSIAAPLAASSIGQWDHEVDIVVCGAGAGGYSAAITAASRGKSVLMLEKAAVPGGTSVKASVIWVPNNSLMRHSGYSDNRNDALAYMARCAMPELYDPSAPAMGLAPEDFALLEAYYDNGSKMLDDMLHVGAIKVKYYEDHGKIIPDYYARLPENKNIIGRALAMVDPDGNDVPGAFVIQMNETAERLKIPILLEHRADQLITNSTGRVVGVRAMHDGKAVSCHARLGVIFASGGFTQNPSMAGNYLRGPIFGGCAVPTNTGDFVRIGAQVDAALGNMSQAWWSEVVVEEAMAFSTLASSIFDLPGDSMLAVNRLGKRFYNEHGLYNERSQAHFYWDPERADYTNLLSFMIYDERVAKNPASNYPYPVPVPGYSAPYVITGKDLPSLVGQIEARLKLLAGKSSCSARIPSSYHLAPGFLASLQDTIGRFNKFAETGQDEDFGRGQAASDQYFSTGYSPSNMPNKALYPIAEQGPYYCIIVGPGTLDTKGGPIINPHGQVMNVSGEVVSGLYGAGNCVAGAARQSYWSAGATVGSAMIFGYLAAQHACGSV